MEAKELKLLAAGRWASIVTSLAPHLGQAVERTPNHVPCPVHGGIDGFRLFRDFDATGGGVCNTCGIHHDGYTLLMWANGWDFLTTHRAIHDMLLGSGEKYYAPLPAKKVCVKKEENRQDIRDSLQSYGHACPRWFYLACGAFYDAFDERAIKREFILMAKP